MDQTFYNEYLNIRNVIKYKMESNFIKHLRKTMSYMTFSNIKMFFFCRDSTHHVLILTLFLQVNHIIMA